MINVGRVTITAANQETIANIGPFRFARMLDTFLFPLPAGAVVQVKPYQDNSNSEYFQLDTTNRLIAHGREFTNFNIKSSALGDYWFLYSTDDELIKDFDPAQLVAAVDTSTLAKDTSVLLVNTAVRDLLSATRNIQLVGSGNGPHNGTEDQLFTSWGQQNLQVTLNITGIVGTVTASIYARDALGIDTLLGAFAAEAGNGNFVYNIGPSFTTAGRNLQSVVPMVGFVRLVNTGANNVYGWGGTLSH